MEILSFKENVNFYKILMLNILLNMVCDKLRLLKLHNYIFTFLFDPH